MGSIFARLKQWALRADKDNQILITDQQGQEYHVDPLTEYHPVKGLGLQLGADYPELDPIELYAWFLGMNINWRERGIYLKYFMTFPVAYPNEVKEKIRATFTELMQLAQVKKGLAFFEADQARSIAEQAGREGAGRAGNSQVEPSRRIRNSGTEYIFCNLPFSFVLKTGAKEDKHNYSYQRKP